MEIKIGDKLKDNDPRMPNRVLTVTALGARTEIRVCRPCEHEAQGRR